MEVDRMIIKGFAGYDGEYPFDLSQEPMFLTYEWEWIKKIAGYMPGTINEGYAGRDPMLFVAFGVIALFRAGKIPVEAAVQLGEMLKFGDRDTSIIHMLADREDEASPPDVTPDEPSVPAANGSGSNGFSGTDSAKSSESQAIRLAPSGDQT